MIETLRTWAQRVWVERDEAAIDAMLALGKPAATPKFKVGPDVYVPVELIPNEAR